jgi:hypothetical protein
MYERRGSVGQQHRPSGRPRSSRSCEHRPPRRPFSQEVPLVRSLGRRDWQRPLSPNGRLKKILTAATLIGEAMAKVSDYERPPCPERTMPMVRNTSSHRCSHATDACRAVTSTVLLGTHDGACARAARGPAKSTARRFLLVQPLPRHLDVLVGSLDKPPRGLGQAPRIADVVARIPWLAHTGVWMQRRNRDVSRGSTSRRRWRRGARNW